MEKDVNITDIWNMLDLMEVIVEKEKNPTPDVTYMLCEIILSLTKDVQSIAYATSQLKNVVEYIAEYNQ